MNPSDFQYSQSAFRSSLIALCWFCTTTVLDLPSCTTYLPLHATPKTPEDLSGLLICLSQKVTAFPIGPEGRHPHLVNEASSGSLALRPVALPLRNLQHTITRILLHGTTGTNEQFPGQDFNLLDMLPITAYGPTPSSCQGSCITHVGKEGGLFLLTVNHYVYAA